MEETNKIIRLSKAAREFNIGISTIVEFLSKKGYEIENNPNTKISSEMYDILVQEFQSEKKVKEVSKKIGLEYSQHESISIEDKKEVVSKFIDEDDEIISKDLLIQDVKSKLSPEKSDQEKKIVKTEPLETQKEDETEKSDLDKSEDDEEKNEPIPDKIKDFKILGKIDLDSINFKTKPSRKTKEEKAKAVTEKDTPKKEEKTIDIQKKSEEEKKEDNFLPTKFDNLTGPKIIDKIDLPEKKEYKKPVASSKDVKIEHKKKRKRIRKQNDVDYSQPKTPEKLKHPKKGKVFKGSYKHEPSEEEIQKQIKDTLARLSPIGKSKASKYRRQKRDAISQNKMDQLEKAKADKSIIKVTEFVSANELATMMNVHVNEIISTCMSLGIFLSINQRLDAETLSLVAEEFGYKVEFVSVDVQEAIHEVEEEDSPDELIDRTPIVTVMGHVDHGKTLLLDYIRKTNVVAGEAGGITQHIGAYEVTLDGGEKITFLDTPGHEAFTAMRARGAKVTDVAIIIIAADDSIKPQTIEAINHAQAAGVPMVFAINKIDKPTANAEKVKEGLSKMNILVEDWGGKYQCQEISAKTGLNIDSLLVKVLLEAEMLQLKGNPNKLASGTVIESSLDKGRGYIAKLLVQNGTIRIGDYLLAGTTFGKVKAMYNERNQLIKEAGPSVPLLLLGLNGAPQAGDKFNVMHDERDAKSIANKRLQLQREQGIRTQKHITLDEIGRRIAIGDFKELNVIVKGDVDGSIEALSDSLIKLSSEEVQVNVIHKSVGAVTESDVLLASASDAVIIGFQVRPTAGARKLAETEQIDIRLYSIIYQAIEELKAAIEGMLSPDIEEKIVCNIEIREVFKISKVGTIAGCMVLDGKITRNTKVRLIRDGIVVYTGTLGSLKRFKEDVKEVQSGYECGLNIENFNDIKTGDIIEGYEQIEIKRKL